MNLQLVSNSLNLLFLAEPPTRIRVIDTTCSSVSLSWNTSADDGGAPIEGYVLEMTPYIPKEDKEEEQVKAEEEDEDEEDLQWTR